MSIWPIGVVLSALLVAPGAGPADATPDAERVPSLRVTTVLSGLGQPWDLAFISAHRFLFTERDGTSIWLGSTAGGKRRLGTAPHVWNGGETGMMAIELAPDFSTSRRFYTCHGYRKGRTHDVRVARWKLNSSSTKVRKVKTIVKGLPSTSGRHGGCSLVFGRGGALYIGTGDATVGTNPQKLRSGGGKVLRVVPKTGNGWPTNPFHKSKYAMKRRVFSYGHRNVQGLARRGKEVWAIEQGSYRDDEVNYIRKRGNYGWNPVPGYNESVPMTNHGLPGRQRSAKWRSGNPTIATTGGVWLRGSRWGSWSGKVLAVTTLKNESLRLLRFSAKRHLTWTAKPAALNKRYGRLRGAVIGPDHALYLTTSNANGTNKILRVTLR